MSGPPARRGQRSGTTPGTDEPRFPGYDVLGQTPAWDDETKAVVLSRLRRPGPLRFFTAIQEPTARSLVDRLLAQDHEPRVPVVEAIDQRLADRRGDGYRFADMPEDWEAWSRSIDGLDADAQEACGRSFAGLARQDQTERIERLRRLEGRWHGMPAPKVFGLWLRYVCDAFYAHPWAWNEIGFGGPAYPRGYKNLGLGRREPWERPERDAEDPVPWAEQAEQARAEHAASGAGRVANASSDRSEDPARPGGRPDRSPAARGDATHSRPGEADGRRDRQEVGR